MAKSAIPTGDQNCRFFNRALENGLFPRTEAGADLAQSLGMLARPSPLVEKVIGCAIEVHRTLGPGLLESAYEDCLCQEFLLEHVPFERQVELPLVYKGVQLTCMYRIDVIVDRCLVLELKSVDRLHPIHSAQMLTYLRLLGLKQGLLMNLPSW